MRRIVLEPKPMELLVHPYCQTITRRFLDDEREPEVAVVVPRSLASLCCVTLTLRGRTTSSEWPMRASTLM